MGEHLLVEPTGQKKILIRALSCETSREQEQTLFLNLAGGKIMILLVCSFCPCFGYEGLFLCLRDVTKGGPGAVGG